MGQRPSTPPVAVSKDKYKQFLLEEESDSDHDSLFRLSTEGRTIDGGECEISWSRANEEDESSFPSRPASVLGSVLGSVPGSLQYSISPSEELELLDEGYFVQGFVDVGHLPRL